MSSPFVKLQKTSPMPTLINGYLYDECVISKYQQEGLRIFNKTIQFEEEAYLSGHPEICAMLNIGIARLQPHNSPRRNLKCLACLLTRPFEELDKEIREHLNIPNDKPYFAVSKGTHKYKTDIKEDLWELHKKYNPMVFDEESLKLSQVTTQSSSFISFKTSDTTLTTPEPSPVRSPTTSEIFYGIISRIVEKATITGLEDAQILYDAAYVAVMKAIENAMELTVVDIKEDIKVLINMSFRCFNAIINERAKIVAHQNWERRMRKKLKRTLRQADNFKGYETPQTPKSVASSHESYKIPPPLPCECHPQFHYNRYPKDRFGIYLPQNKQFCDGNVTVTPMMSDTDINESENDQKQSEDVSKKNNKLNNTTSTPVAPTSALVHKEDAKLEETKIYKTDTASLRSTATNSSRKEAVDKEIDGKSTMPRRSAYIDSLSGTTKKNISNEIKVTDIHTERLNMLTFVKREIRDEPVSEDLTVNIIPRSKSRQSTHRTKNKDKEVMSHPSSLRFQRKAV